MKLLLLLVCSLVPTILAGPLEKEAKLQAVLNDIEMVLQGLKEEEPAPTKSPVEGDITVLGEDPGSGQRTFNTPMEEMLLHADDVAKAEQEVNSVGGRVTMQLGQDLLVAQVPTHIATSQQTFAHSSTHISNSASQTTLINARAYQRSREDRLGPQPPVMSWTVKTAPMAFAREDSDTLIQGESPYSKTLTGKIVVLVLIASGPGSLAISDSERDLIISECQTGLNFWTGKAPSSASLSFALYWGKTTISASNPSSCSSASACHNVFADATLQAFGYPTGQAGKDQLAQQYKDHESANGAFIAFFSKYSQIHFAYAYFNGGPTYMQYSNDGWGPNQIDRVFAHEMGHIFNAPDEYTSCKCYDNYGQGSCTARNTNCYQCNSSQKACIMDSNDLNNICEHSRKHVGWC